MFPTVLEGRCAWQPSEITCLLHNRNYDWVFHIGAHELASSFRQCEGRETPVPASASFEGSDAAGPLSVIATVNTPS